MQKRSCEDWKKLKNEKWVNLMLQKEVNDDDLQVSHDQLRSECMHDLLWD